ncbi:unnamed protein product, partial [Lymnaea stagnalis]
MTFDFGNFKSSVAEGVQKCIGQQWTHDDYSDVTVVVEDMEFHCHKFMLSSCSSFFNGLLRAEMRESIENRAVLKSMSKETFAVIINAVYKGENGLTKENILPVWRATIFLDIPFLIEMCEYFVSQDISLTNFEIYYESAKLLGRTHVLRLLHNFMIRNFQQINDRKTFFELSAEEICNMVDSHFLKVDSEDVVIESILQWINYEHHDVEMLVDGSTDDSLDDQDYRNEMNNAACRNDQSKEGINLGDSGEQTAELTMDATNCSKSELRASTTEMSKSVICSIYEADGMALVNTFETHQRQQTTSPEASTDTRHTNPALKRESELNLNEGSERADYVIKLLKSTRMHLVSRGCLENLTRNAVITSNLDAMNIVYEALVYKKKAVNYGNTILRYREHSNIINGVAFVCDNLVFLYNLLDHQAYTLFDKDLGQEQFSGFVGLTAINSALCFTTTKKESVLMAGRSRSIVTDTTFKYLKLYNTEDDSFSELGKSMSSHISFLLNYNDNIICTDNLFVDVTVFRPSEEISLGLRFLNTNITPSHATIFEDDILIFYVSGARTGIKSCKPRNKVLVTLPDIDGPADKMTSFQHDA